MNFRSAPSRKMRSELEKDIVLSTISEQHYGSFLQDPTFNSTRVLCKQAAIKLCSKLQSLDSQSLELHGESEIKAIPLQ